jgi:hypothetical protein
VPLAAELEGSRVCKDWRPLMELALMMLSQRVKGQTKTHGKHRLEPEHMSRIFAITLV